MRTRSSWSADLQRRGSIKYGSAAPLTAQGIALVIGVGAALLFVKPRLVDGSPLRRRARRMSREEGFTPGPGATPSWRTQGTVK
jgi:hypothetical protein